MEDVRHISIGIEEPCTLMAQNTQPDERRAKGLDECENKKIDLSDIFSSSQTGKIYILPDKTPTAIWMKTPDNLPEFIDNLITFLTKAKEHLDSLEPEEAAENQPE